MLITEKTLDMANRMYYAANPDLFPPINIETEEEPVVEKLCRNCGKVTTASGADCAECDELKATK